MSNDVLSEAGLGVPHEPGQMDASPARRVRQSADWPSYGVLGEAGLGVVLDPEYEARLRLTSASVEAVDHPAHYGGADNPYEAIKVIEAWGLGFCLGNTVKYLSRAGKKGSKIEDLRKAAWYLQREIDALAKEGA
jgi:hypothetical protein